MSGADMAGNPWFRRKHYFIKRGFQINFSIRFLLLIVVEAVLIAGLFWYLSLNTLTTGYDGSQLRITSTSDYFLPSLIVSNVVIVLIVGVIGIIGLLLISHRIAGPLYRFEKGVNEVSKGDLSYRFRTRKGDQLIELSESLNSLIAGMEARVEEMNRDLEGVLRTLNEIKPYFAPENVDRAKVEQLSGELSQRIAHLKETLDNFRTSQDVKKESNLQD
jgi:methyl-accepting chemotaxis protein